MANTTRKGSHLFLRVAAINASAGMGVQENVPKRVVQIV